jgi:hypothetical protein
MLLMLHVCIHALHVLPLSKIPLRGTVVLDFTGFHNFTISRLLISLDLQFKAEVAEVQAYRVAAHSSPVIDHCSVSDFSKVVL